jgi:small subunit ribosomal protein S6e
MRKDFPGIGRRRLLLTKGVGFKPKENGLRRKKSIKGNTINQNIVQINMGVTKYSSKPIDKLITSEKKEEGEAKEEKK